MNVASDLADQWSTRVRRPSRPKESVVSCASEIRIADASTSVESGAITACAHGYRVPFAKAVSTSGATYVARRTLLS